MSRARLFMPGWLVWISVYALTTFDDIMFSVYLVSKESLAGRLGVLPSGIYHISSFYLLGIWIGSVFWNVVSRCFSLKKIIVFCQLALLWSILYILWIDSIQTLLWLRLLNGFFVTGSYISINTLMKKSFQVNDFNHFLAMTIFFNCVAEGLIIKASDSVIYSYGFKAIPIFLMILLLVGLIAPFSNLCQDFNQNKPIREAVRDTFVNYKNIINSKLIIVLAVIGISEGMVDLIFTLMDRMISNQSANVNNTLISNTLAIVSVGSSVYANFISHFVREKSVKSDGIFNWKMLAVNNDKKHIFGILIASSVTLLVAFFNPQYLYFTIAICCLTSFMYAISYIGAKILYSCYQSPQCVASSILSFQAFSSMIIQHLSQFTTELSNNGIFSYMFMYVALMGGLFWVFYRLLDNQKLLEEVN